MPVRDRVIERGLTPVQITRGPKMHEGKKLTRTVREPGGQWSTATVLLVERKTRYVRTPEGARFYGEPVGAPITPDVIARARGRIQGAMSGLTPRRGRMRAVGQPEPGGDAYARRLVSPVQQIAGYTRGSLPPDTKTPNGRYTAAQVDEALDDLDGEGWAPIEHLLTTDYQDPYWQDTVDAIDSAMTPSKERFRGFRSIQDGEAVFGSSWSEETSLEGLTFEDPVYNPVSNDWRAMAQSGAKTIMRVTVPEGTETIGMSDTEMLVGRGHRYRVTTDHGVVDGVRQLEVELIPDGQDARTPRSTGAGKAPSARSAMALAPQKRVAGRATALKKATPAKAVPERPEPEAPQERPVKTVAAALKRVETLQQRLSVAREKRKNSGAKVRSKQELTIEGQLREARDDLRRSQMKEAEPKPATPPVKKANKRALRPAERDTTPPAKHAKARKTRHPKARKLTPAQVAGGRKQRTQKPEGYPSRGKVARGKESWATDDPGYSPSTYTAPSTQLQVVKKVDPETGKETVTTKRPVWSQPADIKQTEQPEFSYEGDVVFDEDGYPLNPRGRTGMGGKPAELLSERDFLAQWDRDVAPVAKKDGFTDEQIAEIRQIAYSDYIAAGGRSRGLLGKWGANPAADPILTREDPETGKLQVALIKRGHPVDGVQEWAIPGGMVDPGEEVTATLAREFEEETGHKLNFDDARRIYVGMVDDPRNADHAWMETIAAHKHLTGEDAKVDFPGPEDEGEIAGVRWVDADEITSGKRKLYASHTDFVRKAVTEHKASERKKAAAAKRQSRPVTKPAVAPPVQIVETDETPIPDRPTNVDDREAVLAWEAEQRTRALDAPPVKLSDHATETRRGQLKLDRRQKAKDPLGESLLYYQHFGDEHMNGLLRHGKPDIPEDVDEDYKPPSITSMKRSIREIDRAMEQSHLTHSIVVYRGIGSVVGMFGEGDIIGREFTDEGFTSASADRDTADGFGWEAAANAARRALDEDREYTRDVGTLEIRVPPGVGAIQISDEDFTGATSSNTSEFEILLQRGLTFRVVEDRRDVPRWPDHYSERTSGTTPSSVKFSEAQQGTYRHIVVEVVPRER